MVMQMDAKGQSILEVVFIMPFLFLFVMVLFKLNLAIQSSINNAQYSRSQLLSLAANSSDYPRISFRTLPKTGFIALQQDMMLIGVADPTAINQAGSSSSGAMEPIPQTQKIDKTGVNIQGSNDNGEQTKRNEMRIRNTAAICTQFNTPPITGAARWPFKQVVCQYTGQFIGDNP